MRAQTCEGISRHSLRDLREAIARDDVDRRAAAELETHAPLTLWQHYLRLATYGSAGQSAVTLSLMSAGLHRWKLGIQIASLTGGRPAIA